MTDRYPQELRATRIRRLTSASILVGGVGSAATAGGVWENAVTLVITVAAWVIVIAGTVWLFRHSRRSRAWTSEQPIP